LSVRVFAGAEEEGKAKPATTNNLILPFILIQQGTEYQKLDMLFSSAKIAAALWTIGATCLLFDSGVSFITRPTMLASTRQVQLTLSSQDEIDSDPKKKVEFKSNNPLELAAWYGVEAFGKVFSKKNGSMGSSGDVDLAKSPLSMKETLARIQLDNDRYYFLSGEVDRLIYDEDCVFADPFVSFNGKMHEIYCLVSVIVLLRFFYHISGRDRFIDNLSNLGSFITNYDAKMINYDVNDDGSEVNTKVSSIFSSNVYKLAMVHLH
jgi:hypothetical protein